MARSHLEAIRAARRTRTKRKCPIKAKARKGEKLYDVPNTFIRDVIMRMNRMYKVAGDLVVYGRRGSDNGVWMSANEEAQALEVLIFEHLRRVRGENRTHRYELFKGWKYNVTRTVSAK